MGRPSMKQSKVDLSDVQGLVRFGYGKLKGASYALLHVKNAAAARAWLSAAPITTAQTLPRPPKSTLQVAFTAAGLKALDVSDPVLAQFSAEFRAGMSIETLVGAADKALYEAKAEGRDRVCTADTGDADGPPR